jgi:uncharacterized membrane protein
MQLEGFFIFGTISSFLNFCFIFIFIFISHVFTTTTTQSLQHHQHLASGASQNVPAFDIDTFVESLHSRISLISHIRGCRLSSIDTAMVESDLGFPRFDKWMFDQ